MRMLSILMATAVLVGVFGISSAKANAADFPNPDFTGGVQVSMPLKQNGAKAKAYSVVAYAHQFVDTSRVTLTVRDCKGKVIRKKVIRNVTEGTQVVARWKVKKFKVVRITASIADPLDPDSTYRTSDSYESSMCKAKKKGR